MRVHALETVTIGKRYRGPSRSGNGGYVCGLLAAHIEGAAEVTLRVPPPLDIPLTIEGNGNAARLCDGDAVVALARAVELDMDVPAAPDVLTAEQAAVGFAGHHHHPFPSCFVCGPERQEGDGLRIFTGPLDESVMVAAPWRVDPSLADGGAESSAIVWAALDCPGFFASVAPGEVAVLGRLTAEVHGTVMPGEVCVVTAWPLGADKRKRHSGSAVHGADGRLIGRAKAVWVVLDSGRAAAMTAKGVAPSVDAALR